MGASSSTPTSAQPPADEGWKAVETTQAAAANAHDAALGWVQIHLCREHFEAFLKCQQTEGCDTKPYAQALVACQQSSEAAAWRQLEHNAMIQCPQQFKSYAECMTSAAVEERNVKCKTLWIAMQMCAAEHVNRHVETQRARTDGKFVPPPMYNVQQARRRRLTPEEQQQQAASRGKS